MPVNPPPLLDSSFELVKLFKFSLSPTPPFNFSAAYSTLPCMLTSDGNGLGFVGGAQWGQVMLLIIIF